MRGAELEIIHISVSHQNQVHKKARGWRKDWKGDAMADDNQDNTIVAYGDKSAEREREDIKWHDSNLAAYMLAFKFWVETSD